jgi:hypothetical protein
MADINTAGGKLVIYIKTISPKSFCIAELPKLSSPILLKGSLWV